MVWRDLRLNTGLPDHWLTLYPLMYSCGPLHMDDQRKGDELEHTYSSSVPIREVTLKTCWKQWAIGRGDEKVARHEDDYLFIYFGLLLFFLLRCGCWVIYECILLIYTWVSQSGPCRTLSGWGGRIIFCHSE